MIQCLHAKRAVLPISFKSHPYADSVPECGEPCVIDLKKKSGVYNGAVLNRHRFGEGVNKFFFCFVVSILAAWLKAGGGSGSKEGIGRRCAAEGLAQQIDFKLQSFLSAVSNGSGAHPVQTRLAACLLLRRTRLFKQRPSFHRSAVELVEILPVLAAG